MVSPKPVEASDNVPVKKERKKKTRSGETVADRLLASAKRMEELRLSESAAAKTSDTTSTPTLPTTQVPVKEENVQKTKRKLDLTKPTHEIDDLSSLEWETSSEQSGL